MKKNLLVLFTLSIFAFTMLTGCQNADQTTSTAAASIAQDSTGQDTADESQTDQDTIIVTDARGEVEIPANPQKIVDLSGNSDILSVLGYSVIGTANSDAYDYTKFPSYLKEALNGAKILGYSMQDTMDIEGVLELEPDLIIISSVQEKMYDKLQQIAPTVMIELAQINWKEDIHAFAEMMNKDEVAERWLEDYEEKAAAKGSEIKEAHGGDTTYLAMLASGGQLYVFDAAGIGGVLYEDMGLMKPENMPEQENISLPVITYEGLAEIDADYMVIVGTDTDMESLKQNSIYNNMRAVSEGNVIELPSSPYFNMGYSCIGKEIFLDEFASLMEK